MSHWVQHQLHRQKSRVGVMAAINKFETCGYSMEPVLEELRGDETFFSSTAQQKIAAGSSRGAQ